MDLIHVHIFVPNKDYCKVEGVAECERILSAIRGASNNEVVVIKTVYDTSNPSHQALSITSLPYMVIYDPKKQTAFSINDTKELSLEGIRKEVAYFSVDVQYDKDTDTYYDTMGEVEPLMSIKLGKSQLGLGGLGLSSFPLFNWGTCDKYLPPEVCNKDALKWLVLIIVILLIWKILK